MKKKAQVIDLDNLDQIKREFLAQRRCFIVVPGAPKGRRIATVAVGQSGYDLPEKPNEKDEDTEAQAQQCVEVLNRFLGIPPQVAEAMILGSMFGWQCDAAKPAWLFWAQTQTQAVQ